MEDIFNSEFQHSNVPAKIYAALEKVHDVIKAAQWNMAKHHGLSPLQLTVLLFIKNHAPQLSKPALLAKEFLVTKPTMTETINALARKGLVLKEKDIEDTRSSFIRLTKAGVALVKEITSYPQFLLKGVEAIKFNDQNDMLLSLFHLLNNFLDENILIPERNCFTCRHYKGDKQKNHRCELLKRKLSIKTLRFDCGEHEPKP